MIRKKEHSELRARRHRRSRIKLRGTANRPRLSVFRSEKHIYAQLIDDEHSVTLAAASSLEPESGELKAPKTSKTKTPKTKIKAEKTKEEKPPGELSRPLLAAKTVGRLVARKALDKGIGRAVFDRGGFKFHGRVKALAEGAREGGLQF